MSSLKQFAISELVALLQQLDNIFDIVRLVDPISNRVLHLGSDEHITYEEYRCYRVWEKEKRCENCISLHCYFDETRKTKFEFIDEDVFLVIAYPLIMTGKDMHYKITLEMVAKITDEVLFEAFGKLSIIEKITSINKKLYEDSLTKVFNRRFFDENIYFRSHESQQEQSIAFIMIDLQRFKQINDNYGHETGDRVLESVGAVLKNSVKEQDAVIRIGGDEFLVIMRDVTEEAVQKKIACFRKRFSEIDLGQSKNDVHVVGNFGYAFSVDFHNDAEFIHQMLKTADARMYDEKKVARQQQDPKPQIF